MMIRRCRTRQPTPSRSSLAISQRARHTPGPGCASVGTLVVLSAGLLVLGVPDDVLPDSTSWALTDVAWLVLPESASRGSMDKTWTKKGELY